MDQCDDRIAKARLLRSNGDLDGALALLQPLLRDPVLRTDALIEIGALMNAAGQAGQAEKAFGEALKTEPENRQALLGLADAFLSMARTEDAWQVYADLETAFPDDADILLGLGECALQTGGYAEARLHLAAALEARPGDADILFNLGQALQECGDAGAAIRTYKDAIAALGDDPAAAVALNKLGSVHAAAGDWPKALKTFRRAVEFNPDFVAAQGNLGEACRESGLLKQAKTAFDRAIALDPAYAPARFNRSILRLLQGRYIEAWEDYEQRWNVPPLVNDPRSLPMPRWSGEPVAGKTVLIHAEQGIGDTVQFMRFLPIFIRAGVKVRFALDARLARLASAIDGVEVHSLTDLPNLAADFHCPLMSLAGKFGATPEMLPAPAPLPEPDDERVAFWRQRFDGDGRKIGICWQGNPNAAADRGRSPPLLNFAPLAEMDGVQLIALQKTDGMEQIAEIRGAFDIALPGPDFDSGPDAFADTLALMEIVDLVVTGDTAIAHLAASLGVPTWIALKHIPDWRWGLTGEKCAWYSSARLFRQASPGGWDSVFASMAERLEAAGLTGGL